MAPPHRTTFDIAFFSLISTGIQPSAPAIKLPKKAALATSNPSNMALNVHNSEGMRNPIEHVKKMRDSQCVRLQVLRSQASRHSIEPPKHIPATKMPTIAGTFTTLAATPNASAKAVIKVTLKKSSAL